MAGGPTPEVVAGSVVGRNDRSTAVAATDEPDRGVISKSIEVDNDRTMATSKSMVLLGNYTGACNLERNLESVRARRVAHCSSPLAEFAM